MPDRGGGPGWLTVAVESRLRNTNTVPQNGSSASVSRQTRTKPTVDGLTLRTVGFIDDVKAMQTVSAHALRNSIWDAQELPDENFEQAVRIAQAEFDQHQPQVVGGSSRGGAVAMNINSGSAKLVLLCPAWKKWGTAKTVWPDTVILHSKADDVVPFADLEELALSTGATLIEVGTDHRLADPEPLAAMLRECEGAA